MRTTTMTKIVKILSGYNVEEFQRSLSRRLKNGWVIASSNCTLAPDEHGDPAEFYQAMLVKSSTDVPAADTIYKVGDYVTIGINHNDKWCRFTLGLVTSFETNGRINIDCISTRIYDLPFVLTTKPKRTSCLSVMPGAIKLLPDVYYPEENYHA